MQANRITRRQFLGTTAVAAAGLMSTGSTVTAQKPASSASFKDRFNKASITSKPTNELCERWKAAGMDGMEVTEWNVSVEEAQKSRLIAEKHGLRIHSVMRGWTTFHEPDQEKWEASIETIRVALRSAAAYGADTVLFAPYELKPLTWPNPWDIDIDFDPKTYQIKTLIPGDNAPFAESIERQNRATQRARQAIETLIPDAAKEGVILAIENVRDNFWCTPKFFSAIIRSFDSLWVKAYYDFANHQKIAECKYWLDALGSEIVKVHIKDFKVKEVKGDLGGGPVGGAKIGEGSTDWKLARKKFEEINYCGWLTVEEGERSIEEYAKILHSFGKGEFPQ